MPAHSKFDLGLYIYILLNTSRPMREISKRECENIENKLSSASIFQAHLGVKMVVSLCIRINYKF